MESVHSGTRDAAGVAGSFTAGVKAAAVQGLSIFSAYNAQGRAGSCFHAYHKTFPAETGQTAVILKEPVFQVNGDKGWQDLSQIIGNKAAPIGCLKRNG